MSVSKARSVGRILWRNTGQIAGLLALFVVIGGPAWAADMISGAMIKRSTITGKHVRNGALTGADIRNGSVATADVRNRSITTAKLAPSAIAPRARALPGLRTEPDVTTPNIIGGSTGNSVTPSALGATIGGGGAASFLQAVTDDFGTVAGGRGNSAGNASGTTSDVIAATVGGGEGNAATGSYGTVPGGIGNSAVAYSFAAGRRAKAVNQGSFVWADSSNADFTSTADNQFAVRAYNGMFIANDAGSSKTVPVGTRYRDNSIVAWGRISAGGALDSDFNVASSTRIGAGHYEITLRSPLATGFSLIPNITPEIDAPGGVPPTGAANVRIPAVDMVGGGDTFSVFIYNGSFALVDNDFQFMVTGR